MPRKRTRFQDLEVLAVEMTQAEIEEGLRQLARDDRFAAVIGFLVKSEKAWSTKVATEAEAANGQQLAASAGAMGATIRLVAHLGEIIKKATPTQGATPGD